MFAPLLQGQDNDSLKKEVEELRQQNTSLQQQLQQQREMIDQLSRKFSGLQKTNDQQAGSIRDLQESAGNAPPPLEKQNQFSLGKVVLSGEGAAGFFESERNGEFPNAAFRVDEVRLFLDAPIWNDVYFFGQIDLQTHEEGDYGVFLSELYLQWENLTKNWGQDGVLNARIGQFYTPFGEEYQRRFAIDNPLISHSLSDLWGLNPGLELYGAFKHLNYAVAVQNGGLSVLNDGTADKLLAGRIGYDVAPWLSLSVNGMRTGQLSVNRDFLSTSWFGSGFFQSIGSTNATDFQVNLAEFDADAKWKGGDIHAAGGWAGYWDNDVMGDNHRDIYYYYVEALQHATPKLYGVARWSQIRAPKGYPIMGGTTQFFLPTTDVWRMSLGLGYQFTERLVLKVEYMFEGGELVSGSSRNHENMFAAEAAFKF